MADDTNLGLYKKFRVVRADGSKKHEHCSFFVIDINHDEYAALTLKAYADLCEREFPKLARDLRSICGA